MIAGTIYDQMTVPSKIAEQNTFLGNFPFGLTGGEGGREIRFRTYNRRNQPLSVLVFQASVFVRIPS